ncbi:MULTISPECIES: TRAP transporter small permease [Rhodomicrobium]|uniref:TRAP transporter small permease subunit n=1 Tax=Rhodomicrobium TaxID=1068 RepID=UPI000B4BC886|nr:MULTISPECIES: TRAP transporter small permease [Rhodomicrobium]
MTDDAGEEASLLRRALDALYLGAGWLAGAFLIVIFLLMMGLSIGRQIGINIPAGDEFTAWSMAAMAFLGLAHTFKSGDMIRVGLITERLTGRTKQVFEIGALLIALAFTGYFTWYAFGFTYYSWLTNDVAQGVVPLPLWIPQTSYCAGLALLAIAILDELVHVLRGHLPRYEKEPPRTAEEVVERAVQSAV